MKTKVGGSLPAGSALLSGMPSHLLDDQVLTASLRRMGLAPGPVIHSNYAGVMVREWPIDLADCPMRLVRIAPSDALAGELSGRYAGSEGRDFAPSDGHVLLLCWDEAASRTPDGELETILTTLALLSAFLFPQLIQWRPARLWSRAPDFTQAIEKHLNGSPLPVLHLVGFERTGKGINGRIGTRGLRVFTGQELSADASRLGAAETVRRLARLVLEMFEHGPVLRRATIDGLVPGERITLTPKPGDQGPAIVEIAIALEHKARLDPRFPISGLGPD